MNLINLNADSKKFLEQDERNYAFVVNKVRLLAENGLLILDNFGIEEILKEKEHDFNSYVQFIINLSKGYMWFPEKIKYNTLQKLGFNENIVRWFISYESLNAEFNNLNKQEIVVAKYPLFYNISLYLSSKIIAELLNDNIILFSDKENPVEENKESNLQKLKNLFRKRAYHEEINTPLTGDDFDLLFNKLIDEYQTINPNIKEVKKHIFKLLNGKTEDLYLKNLKTFFFPLNKISQTQLSLCLSPIFKLLFKDDKELMDLSEFDDQKDPIYGNNYPRYLNMTINKTIRPNEPDFYQNGNL